MLTFLHLASRAGFQIDRYRDEAVGVMTRNELGVPWGSAITLHPQIKWSGDRLPSPPDEALLHHQAHEQCFIANSVKTKVTVEAGKPAPTDVGYGPAGSGVITTRTAASGRRYFRATWAVCSPVTASNRASSSSTRW